VARNRNAPAASLQAEAFCWLQVAGRCVLQVLAGARLMTQLVSYIAILHWIRQIVRSSWGRYAAMVNIGAIYQRRPVKGAGGVCEPMWTTGEGGLPIDRRQIFLRFGVARFDPDVCEREGPKCHILVGRL